MNTKTTVARSDSRNYALVFIAGILWGFVGLFVKSMESLGSTPLYTSLVRLVFGFIILFVITVIKEGIGAFRVSGRGLLSCVLLGLVTQGAFNLTYATAISMTSMSCGAVLLYLSPVFTSITSLILFKEKLNKYKYYGIVICVLGCVLTVTGGNFSDVPFSAVGILFGVGAGLTYSFAPILGRLATDGVSPYAATAYDCLFGAIFLAIFHPWTQVANPLNPQLLIYGVGYAIIPTAIAYLVYFIGVQGIKESSKVPVVASIETVSATVIGCIVFRESIGLVNVIGIAAVLCSIAIMNMKGKKKTEETETAQQPERACPPSGDTSD